MLILALAPLFVAAASAALAYKGVDWSSVIVEEKAGKSYQNSVGAVQPLETILKANGVNTVRQRIWNNPADGNYNLDYNVALAKRAKAAGLDVYLDFHYSDTWADPAHQSVPAAWAKLNIDDLANELYEYTKASLNAFQAAEVAPTLVSIGNEITQGMLWPLGKNSNNAFSNLARLLHSASAGVKDSTLMPKPKIMIHLDNGWNWETQKWWYDAVLAAGPLKTLDFDVQGVSYYPFYNSAATLASLRSSLANMKAAYGKETMVVETDWPSSCSNPKYAFPGDAKRIPLSPEGQTAWMKEVASACAGAGCSGLFYWEPAWIDNAGLGSSCEWNLLVEKSGKVMSSMAVFASI